MAEYPPTRHPAEQGLIGRSLTGLLKAGIFLVIALMFSIFVEWIGLSFFWPDEGRAHSARMLAQEIHYLNKDFKRSVLVEQPAEFARSSADWLHGILYQKSGIERGLIWLAAPSEIPSRVRRWLRKAYTAAADYLVVAMTITQVFAVRLAILILALPAFVLLAVVGLTDGLVQRDLRRWGGGRESAFVYHWAKRSVLPALVLPWILYLAMPLSIHPNFVVLPFAVFFALAIAVMASTFKKYL